MKSGLWLLMLPVVLMAQDNNVARGAAVYRSSCAVAYCHGPDGKAGRAPGLAGRSLDARAIVATATRGIPNTSMPAFDGQLKAEDIEAVAAYIVSLGGSEAAPGAKAKAPGTVPAAVQPGRSLFFDAARISACGSCHEVGGWGVPVSMALQDARTARLDNLRLLETPGVVTARPSGEEPFPAVVAEKTSARIRVYDLSSRIPVLRTFAPTDVVLAPGSSWRHRDAVGIYTDSELEAIAGYLRWAAGR